MLVADHCDGYNNDDNDDDDDDNNDINTTVFM